MELLSKISVKTCKANPEMEFVTVDGKQVPRAKGEQTLLRVTGIAKDKKLVNTDFGTSVQINGMFQGTNIKTGEVFRAAKCFLPEIAAGLVDGALAEGVTEIQFAFDIGVKPANSATGYEYTVKPLIDLTENDPLAMLNNALAKSAPLAIAAPAAPVLTETPAPTADQEGETILETIGGEDVDTLPTKGKKK
jgi:hypothetical protein